jgi:hypothetical protein
MPSRQSALEGFPVFVGEELEEPQDRSEEDMLRSQGLPPPGNPHRSFLSKSRGLECLLDEWDLAVLSLK